MRYIRLIQRVQCTDVVVLLWWMDSKEGMPHKIPQGDYELELWGSFLMSYN